MIENLTNIWLLISTAKVPMICLNFLLGSILLWILLLRFLGFKVPIFYYVTFFGLLPYRLIKATAGAGNVADISLLSAFILLIFLYYIWVNIDKLLYNLFDSWLGQTIVAYTLFVADKFILIDEKLARFPVFRGVIYGGIGILLVGLWVYLDCPYAFFLLLATPIIWYRNFVKNFLQGESLQIYEEDIQKEKLKFPTKPEDFNWVFMIGLVSSVLRRKKNYPLTNRLGGKIGDMTYPNVIKRYFPIDNPAIKQGLNYAGTALGTLGSILIAGGAGTAIYNQRIESHGRQEDAKHEAERRNRDEIDAANREITENARQASELSREYRKMELERLSKEGEKSNYNFEKYNPEETILHPFPKESEEEQQKLQNQYEQTLEDFKEATLKKAAVEVVEKKDIKTIKRDMLEKVLTDREDDEIVVLKDNIVPGNVAASAENDPEVKEILKKNYPTEGCPPVSKDQANTTVEELKKPLSRVYDAEVKAKSDAKDAASKRLANSVARSEDSSGYFSSSLLKNPSDWDF